MATPQHNGTSASKYGKIDQSSFAISPLTSLAHGVFSEYTAYDSGPGIVPCVLQKDGEVISYWSTPDFTQYADRHEAAADFARRAAAAVVVMTQRFGGSASITLQDVVTDSNFIAALRGPHSMDSYAAHLFMDQISRYLWGFSQRFSAADIVADAESARNEERFLAEEDEASATRRGVKLSHETAA